MSEKVKHTPGPWTANMTYPEGDWCIHARGIPWQLAYLAESKQIEWPLEANARLIAAAPEMLSALRLAERCLDENKDRDELDAVHAAIRKATGDTP